MVKVGLRFLFLAVAVSGCARWKPEPRTSIEQLYHQAELAALNHPEKTIVPTSLGVPNEDVPTNHPESPEPVVAIPHPESLVAPETGFKPPPSEGSLLTQTFEDTDVREAIQVIAQECGRSVVLDDGVGGTTSAVLVDETFENSLRKILMPLGYVFGKHGDVYLIGSPDPESPLFPYFSISGHYEPKHRKVDELVSLLPNRLRKYVRKAEGRNLILIDAPAEIVQETCTRMAEVDQAVPQVVLEAVVCVLAPDTAKKFGLDWSHSVKVDGNQSFNAGMSGLSFSGLSSRNGMNQAFTDFAVTSTFLRLLAQEGYVTIRAAPRVMAKDGEKATISINRETFFSLQPSNSSLLFRQDVQKVDAGITLEIIPTIRGDNVSVNIARAEVSEDIRSSVTDTTNNTFPVINRRQVSTSVTVQDQQTIVIGGLVHRQTVEKINSIPGLSKLPLVGKLFTTIDKQQQDVEAAIFISPTIIR